MRINTPPIPTTLVQRVNSTSNPVFTCDNALTINVQGDTCGFWWSDDTVINMWWRAHVLMTHCNQLVIKLASIYGYKISSGIRSFFSDHLLYFFREILVLCMVQQGGLCHTTWRLQHFMTFYRFGLNWFTAPNVYTDLQFRFEPGSPRKTSLPECYNYQ